MHEEAVGAVQLSWAHYGQVCLVLSVCLSQLLPFMTQFSAVLCHPFWVYTHYIVTGIMKLCPMCLEAGKNWAQCMQDSSKIELRWRGTMPKTSENLSTSTVTKLQITTRKLKNQLKPKASGGLKRDIINLSLIKIHNKEMAHVMLLLNMIFISVCYPNKDWSFIRDNIYSGLCLGLAVNIQ